MDETIWGTAALQNATSWFHCDDDGFATVVTVMAGMKYWVVARKNRKIPNFDFPGNLGSISAFGEDWEPSEACSEMFEHEGVLLTPGSVL